MRYYRINGDWITHLTGDFGAEIRETLKGLSLERLQKYPPPKLNGLPIGNEGRIFLRYVRGKSSQLDPSAFSRIYRSFGSSRDILRYLAFRQNEELSPDEWSRLIGTENIGKWISHKCLRRAENGYLTCQFSIVAIDGLVFVVDPINDHYNHISPDFLIENENSALNGDEVLPFYHTYIGLDSLRMIESMEQHSIPGGGRYLDCGPGSGSVFLYFARNQREAIAVDINPRAALLTKFNAELNGLTNCAVHKDDALSAADRYGKFDLVSWNLPFIFMPENQRDDYIDGFGGEMGIGLCLKFIDTLPNLLKDRGIACIAALSPILQNGDNVLEKRLKERVKALGLDCTLQVDQVSLSHTRDQWHFHRSFGIRKFESVYLYLTPGHGRLQRIETPVLRKLVDGIRERFYEQTFAD